MRGNPDIVMLLGPCGEALSKAGILNEWDDTWQNPVSSSTDDAKRGVKADVELWTIGRLKTPRRTVRM